MDNNTKNAFVAMQSDFVNAEASTGGGNVFPSPGEHECYVDSVTIETDQPYRMRVNGQQTEIPGISIYFTYTLVNDPDRETALTFRGERFNLPMDPSKIPADTSESKQTTRYRITMERLKGHLKTLLNTEIEDFGSAVMAVESMLGGETAIVARVEITARKAGDRTYHTEYLKELLSS